MTRLIAATLAIVLLAAAHPDAGGRPKQKKARGPKHEATVVHAGAGILVHVEFGSGEIDLVRRHYAPRFSGLPPGLQKKVARGGTLPPGWQKKLEPFPPVLERRMRPLPLGYRRGVFDAHAVIYDSRGAIIDVAVLF